MGWFSGRYENEQTRAARANSQQAKIGTRDQVEASKRGADNYHKRWWN